MPDALRRAIRTFIQAFVGTFLSMWIGIYVTPGVLPDTQVIQRVLIAAAVAGMIALLTYVQNALEDRGTIRSVGKSPASVGANPVTSTRASIEPH